MARSTRARPASQSDEPPAREPLTRQQLVERHGEARRRRNAAPLGGEAWEDAVAEIGRLEVEMARIDREADPPRI